MKHFNLDVVGIAETHLANNADLQVGGYKWFGNCRKQVHNKAWNSSGGVGFLVSEECLQDFDVKVADNSYEGILWITIVHKRCQNAKFRASVCYLPPEHSSLNVNGQEFYETLLGQVYSFQNDPYYICGDFNSRLGELVDFIEGEDSIERRHVVDFKKN